MTHVNDADLSSAAATYFPLTADEMIVKAADSSASLLPIQLTYLARYVRVLYVLHDLSSTPMPQGVRLYGVQSTY
jgi:hypothetical protein